MKEILFNGGVIRDQRIEIRSRGDDLIGWFDAPYNVLVAEVEQEDKSYKTTPLRILVGSETENGIAREVELMTQFGEEDNKKVRNFRLGTVSAKRAREWGLVPGYSVVNIDNQKEHST